MGYRHLNEICKKYIKQVKKAFPVLGIAERRYIKRFSNELNDYCAKKPPESIEELYSNFEKPKDVAAAYYNNLSKADISSRIKTSLLIKRIAVGLSVIAAVFAVSFCIYLCCSFHVFVSEMSVEIETFISEQK